MPRPSNRPARLARVIREELAEILLRGLKDPRIRSATVSGVEVSRDLRNAKVFVQVIGDPKEREATVKGLSRAAGFLRRELLHRMSIRSVPELRFVLDEAAERADRVMGILAKLDRERRGAADLDESE